MEEDNTCDSDGCSGSLLRHLCRRTVSHSRNTVRSLSSLSAPGLITEPRANGDLPGCVPLGFTLRKETHSVVRAIDRYLPSLSPATEAIAVAVLTRRVVCFVGGNNTSSLIFLPNSCPILTTIWLVFATITRTSGNDGTCSLSASRWFRETSGNVMEQVCG